MSSQITVITPTNKTLLHQVAEFCDTVNQVKKIYKQSPEHIFLQDVAGDTPLHCACRNKNPKIAKYLLKKYGVASNIPNCVGMFPIHVACSNKDDDLELLQALVTKNWAALTIKDLSGKLPLHRICLNGSDKSIIFIFHSFQVAANKIDKSSLKYPVEILIHNKKRVNVNMGLVVMLIQKYGHIIKDIDRPKCRCNILCHKRWICLHNNKYKLKSCITYADIKKYQHYHNRLPVLRICKSEYNTPIVQKVVNMYVEKGNIEIPVIFEQIASFL
jgi:hypothetical protein